MIKLVYRFTRWVRHTVLRFIVILHILFALTGNRNLDEVRYMYTIQKKNWHRTRVTHGTEGKVYKFWTGNTMDKRLLRTARRVLRIILK